jgi:hypothetical protein
MDAGLRRYEDLPVGGILRRSTDTLYHRHRVGRVSPDQPKVTGWIAAGVPAIRVVVSDNVGAVDLLRSTT